MAGHPFFSYFVLAFAGTWLLDLPLMLGQDGLALLPYHMPFVLYAAICYTGVTTATVHIGNGQGDLYSRNSGLYLPSGELTELETIIGGTGAWVSASGVLFEVRKKSYTR